MSFLATLRKEMMEQWRTSRLLVLVIVLGVSGMMSPLLAKFTPEILKAIPEAEQFAAFVPTPIIQDAIDQYIKNIGQFSLLLAVFLSMGSVVQEKERGSAVLMLVKPLSRGSFLMAKFISLSLTFLAALAVSSGLGYLYTVLLFEAPSVPAWLWLNGLLWLYCLVYVAITLLASTLMRSQAAAAGVSFGALLVMAGVGALPGLGQYLPNQLINWGAELFRNPAVVYWPALIVSLAIIAACLAAAWLIFRQQEL
jgi:ABC-2 type transport system permease protein